LGHGICLSKYIARVVGESEMVERVKLEGRRGTAVIKVS
jgi:hypothetical protein